MGRRGPGDQTDRGPPYGYEGDGQWHLGRYLSEQQDHRKGEAFLRSRPAENDAGESMGGKLMGQQNMGAYLNANRRK